MKTGRRRRKENAKLLKFVLVDAAGMNYFCSELTQTKLNHRNSKPSYTVEFISVSVARFLSLWTELNLQHRRFWRRMVQIDDWRIRLRRRRKTSSTKRVRCESGWLHVQCRIPSRSDRGTIHYYDADYYYENIPVYRDLTKQQDNNVRHFVLINSITGKATKIIKSQQYLLGLLAAVDCWIWTLRFS